MKKVLGLFALVLALGMTVSLDAEAKRLGGGGSKGMQRQQTTQPANTPAQTPTTAGAAAPAAAGTAAAAAGATAKRSWMGPIAGLAAGLGLMALASHFGFGEAMANMMLIGLAIMAVLLVVGFVMRKRAMAAGGGAAPGASGGSPAWAGAGGAPAGGSSGGSPLSGTRIGSALGAGVSSDPNRVGNIPADFDVAAFSRNAKSQFMALQSANDAGDFDRLRDYLTPEMFESVREEVQARAGATQTTEVFGLEAQVVDVTEEADRYIVSVKFSGSVRDQAGAVPEDLNEVWHLTKPRAGFGGWVVAGIQQV